MTQTPVTLETLQTQWTTVLSGLGTLLSTAQAYVAANPSGGTLPAGTIVLTPDLAQEASSALTQAQTQIEQVIALFTPTTTETTS